MKDAVCGMEVEEDSENQSEHNGKKFAFCSAECKAEFDRNPQKYEKKR